MKITKNSKLYFELLTYKDYLKFLNNEIYNNTVLNLDNIILILPEIKDISISHTNFIKDIRTKIRVEYPHLGSNLCLDYYLIRGYSIKEAKAQISNIQKTHSERCIEHWLKKGFSNKDAIQKVKEIQATASIKSIIKKYGEEEAQEIYNKRCASYSVSKDNLIKKYGEEEGVKRWKKYLKKQSISNSKESILKKYGKSKGEAICKSKGRPGKLNAQWGKPAPKKSGRGIFGYYKDYYFRSTLEYFAIKQFEKENLNFIELDKQKPEVLIRVILDENRTYRPDFLVGDTIFEVKPSGLIDNPIVQHKKQQCENQFRQYKYKFLTENDIETNKDILLSDFNNNLVKIDSGKLERFERIYLK